MKASQETGPKHDMYACHRFEPRREACRNSRALHLPLLIRSPFLAELQPSHLKYMRGGRGGIIE